MCKTCWLDQGAPTEVPDNAAEIVKAIEALYAAPGCCTGGPLHVELDDLNLDMGEWVPYNPQHWPEEDRFTPEALVLAHKVCDLMNPLPVPQRYAVAAAWQGWQRLPVDEDHIAWVLAGDDDE